MALHHVHGSSCGLCNSKMEGVTPRLVEWYIDLVKPAFPLIHVCWGYRGKAEQEQFFKEGKTRAHYPMSNHNYCNPKTGKPDAHAVDLFVLTAQGIALFPRKVYQEISKLCPSVRWGGTFKTICDFDHFEVPRDV